MPIRNKLDNSAYSTTLNSWKEVVKKEIVDSKNILFLDTATFPRMFTQLLITTVKVIAYTINCIKRNLRGVIAVTIILGIVIPRKVTMYE